MLINIQSIRVDISKIYQVNRNESRIRRN